MNLRHRKSVRHAGYLQHYRAQGPAEPLLQWPIFTRKSLAGFARKLTVECAERELIGIAVRKPKLWSRLSHVQPEWFQQWADQALWRALQFCNESNDGYFDVEVINGWFQEYHRDDAEALLDRLAEISNCYLHSEHIEFNLELLEGAGRRLAMKRWAMCIAEMCEDARPMVDVYEVINTPPVKAGGAE